MLILGVTRVSFTESFAIDASGLDTMNNSRSTCVILKSNLVICCLGGSAGSQNSRLNDGHLILDRRFEKIQKKKRVQELYLHQRLL
ncbi:hypothetical protein T08_7919 [Trichinella sp. T8]|nr:hypothetical protein T08_7919 [Trichinella sp. T8]